MKKLKRRLAGWIKRLGHGKWKERKKASAMLWTFLQEAKGKRRECALDLLIAAAGHENPEIRDRARRLALAYLKAVAKRGSTEPGRLIGLSFKRSRRYWERYWSYRQRRNVSKDKKERDRLDAAMSAVFSLLRHYQRSHGGLMRSMSRLQKLRRNFPRRSAATPAKLTALRLRVGASLAWIGVYDSMFKGMHKCYRTVVRNARPGHVKRKKKRKQAKKVERMERKAKEITRRLLEKR